MQPLLARHVVWNSKKFQLPVKTENVAHWPAPGCSWSKTFHSFNFYNNCNPNQPSAAPRFCFKLQFSDPDLIVSLQENKSHLSFKYPFKFQEKSAGKKSHPISIYEELKVRGRFWPIWPALHLLRGNDDRMLSLISGHYVNVNVYHW